VETFIARAIRYFDALGIQKTMRRVLMIGLIHKGLRDKYETTKKFSKIFEERFRLAFTRKQTLAQDIEDVFSIEDRKKMLMDLSRKSIP